MTWSPIGALPRLNIYQHGLVGPGLLPDAQDPFAFDPWQSWGPMFPGFDINGWLGALAFIEQLQFLMSGGMPQIGSGGRLPGRACSCFHRSNPSQGWGPGASNSTRAPVWTDTPRASQSPSGPAPSPGTNGTATFDSISNEGARNQMATGRITVNGNTYTFRSGGGGNGNLPPGQYTVTPHMYSRGDRSMSVDGVGYSYALSDKYDPRVGDTRSLLRIHPDGGGAGTIGCIGIVGDGQTQLRFREDMQAELARNGGSFTLNVG